LALAPTLAYLEAGDAIYVNTLEASRAQFNVGGHPIEIRQESQFPSEGRSTLTIKTSDPVRFTLKIRVPAWAAPLQAGDASSQGGWLALPEREWRDGDSVTLRFNLSGRVIRGDYTNHARVAYAWGPFILAFDQKLNPEFGGNDAPQFIHAFDDQPPTLMSASGRLILQSKMRGEWDINAHPVKLVPFAEAGAEGGRYAVWLRAP
jgi:DUF1680 family protein